MSTALSEQVMTFDECVDYFHRSGFRWNRSDSPVISMPSAVTLLALIDERLSTVSIGEYDQPYVQELVNARDELQTAICAATEAGL